MANKKHTMVLENRIIITTGEDSFRVVNTLGESVRYDAELPYNSVKTVLGDGDTLTIASVCQGKTRCLVNGLFSDYTLDGQEFNSLSELEEALDDALFKNPEGGGADKTAAHFREVTEIPTEPQTEEDMYDVLLAKRDDDTYAEYKWIAEQGAFVELNPSKDWTFRVMFAGSTVDKTYDQIRQAIRDGKVVYVDDSRGHLNYTYEGVGYIMFTRVDGNLVEQVKVEESGNAIYSSVTNQDTMDRVSSIDGVEEAEKPLKYPSVKLLEDYVANNKGMTEDEAKTVSAALNDLNGRILEAEKSENKATTLDNADDETYPTTKAVKDAMVKVWDGTQEEYDALATKENGTLYLIEEEE